LNNHLIFVRLTVQDLVDAVQAIFICPYLQIVHASLYDQIRQQGGDYPPDHVDEGGTRIVGAAVVLLEEELDEGEHHVHKGHHGHDDQQHNEADNVLLEEEAPDIGERAPGQARAQQQHEEVAQVLVTRDGVGLRAGVVLDGVDDLERDHQRRDLDQAHGQVEQVVGGPVDRVVRAGEELQLLAAVEALAGHGHDHDADDEGDDDGVEEVEERDGQRVEAGEQLQVAGLVGERVGAGDGRVDGGDGLEAAAGDELQQHVGDAGDARGRRVEGERVVVGGGVEGAAQVGQRERHVVVADEGGDVAGALGEHVGVDGVLGVVDEGGARH